MEPYDHRKEGASERNVECVMFGNDGFADDVVAWAVLTDAGDVLFIHLDKAEAERFAVGGQ